MGYHPEQDGHYHSPDADRINAPANCPNCNAGCVRADKVDIDYACGSFFNCVGGGLTKSGYCRNSRNQSAATPPPQRRKLLPDADEINATVQVYKRLGLKSEKLVDDVQSIVDKIKTLLLFAIQPTERSAAEQSHG